MGNKRYTYYATEVGTLPAKICTRKIEPPLGYSREKPGITVQTDPIFIAINEPAEVINVTFEVLPLKEETSKIAEAIVAPIKEVAPVVSQKVEEVESAEIDYKQRLHDSREENSYLKLLLENSKQQTVSEEAYFELKNRLVGAQTRTAFLTEELEKIKELLFQEQNGRSKLRSLLEKHQEALDVSQNNLDVAIKEIRELIVMVDNLEKRIPKAPETFVDPSSEVKEKTEANIFSWSYSPSSHKAVQLSLRERTEKKISDWVRRINEKLKAIEKQKSYANK